MDSVLCFGATWAALGFTAGFWAAVALMVKFSVVSVERKDTP